MWDKIMERTITALVTAAVLAFAVWIVQGASDGGLVRWLGGTTADQFEALDGQVQGLSRFELKVEHATRAQAASGQPILSCPAGWRDTGAEFSETYQRDENGRWLPYHKYFRICMRPVP